MVLMFCSFRLFASYFIVCSRKLFQCYLLTLLLHLVRLCQIADFYFPVSGRTLVLQIIRNNYGCFGESRSVLPVCSAAIRCFERCHRWRFIPFPCYGAENQSFPLPCDKSFCCVSKPAGFIRPALLLPSVLNAVTFNFFVLHRPELLMSQPGKLVGFLFCCDPEFMKATNCLL